MLGEHINYSFCLFGQKRLSFWQLSSVSKYAVAYENSTPSLVILFIVESIIVWRTREIEISSVRLEIDYNSTILDCAN